MSILQFVSIRVVMNFAIRKLGFRSIYNAHPNTSSFKYCINILGGGGDAMYFFVYLGVWVQNFEKQTYVILQRSLSKRT